ncbi:MAG: Hydroxypyruvate reductase [Firmicutes bacterium]|nr:Hydroxypyruvate reductase [candidate division NPL-UPA2 bacterium]
MRVLITPRSFKNYRELVLPFLRSRGWEVVENTSGRTLNEDDLIAACQADIDGIIVGLDPLTDRVLRECRNLKAVSKYGVGLDNIDLATARELGIEVRAAVGSNNVSVAELAIALMFETARRVSAQSARVKAGKWERVLGMELTGKRLGLVGGGQIGQEVAVRARGLKMDVSIYDPYFTATQFLEAHGIQRVDSLQTLLSEADVVSIHAPLTSETKHIISTATLELMKPSAILINTARGELIDEHALHAALSARRIAFAASDVFSSEPPPPDAPLLGLDNFLLTPHTGAYTAEANERMAMLSTQNLIAMLTIGHSKEVPTL